MPISLNILSKFDAKGIAQAQTGLDKLGKAAGGFAAAGVTAFAAAAAGAAAFGYQALRAAAESESVSKSLQQIAKNSGVFGDTADAVAKSTGEIMKYTQSLSNLTGIDDEILNAIVRGWLAVPELAGKGVDGLKDLVKVVADVAAGTGKDIQAIGMIFTKVAGDEETAMSKLARAGIVLSNAQKQIYEETLATSGEIAAQDKLIEILGTTYAGAAEAAADPFAVLTQNIQNLQEELGAYLLPYFKDFVERVQKFIAENGDDLKVAFENVGVALGGVVDGLGDFLAWYTENPDIFSGIVAGFAAITVAATLFSIALSANPVGVIMFALVALGGAIAALAYYWDDVTAKMSKDWTDFSFTILLGAEKTANAVIGFINALNAPLNGLIDLLNGLFGLDIQKLGLAEVNWYADAAVRELQNQGIRYGYTGGASSSNPGGFGNPAFGMMPRFATGGIVTGPTVGLIGEAGPEAIIPLDRLGNMPGVGGNQYTINVSAMNADARVGELVVSAIKRYERSNGPVFVSA
jgi:hypothetical protein